LDAKIDGFIGEEYMKMQDDQIRELFQQKLSGHESAVDPALWNSIQSGISGTAAGTGVAGGSVIAKLGAMKLVAAVVGIVAVCGIVVYHLVSNVPDENPTEVAVNQSPALSDEADNQDISTKIIQSEKGNSKTNESEIASKSSSEDLKQSSSSVIYDLNPLVPIKQENPIPETDLPKTPFEKTLPTLPQTPAQDSNIESFTTDFNVVGPDNMGLTKILIPTYTKASGYRWVINHDETIYEELSTSHEFSRSGEHHIRLEIENTPGSGFTEFSEKTICVCAQPEVSIEYDLFTPNGDSYSKIFDPMIESKNIVPIRLLIFEKSTNTQVFEGLNEEAKWNGKGSYGQEYPAGEYFYQFTWSDLCGKKLVDKTGFIRLER
jgi:hypothetical protein